MASAPPLRIWLYSAVLMASVLALLALLRWAPWRAPDYAIANHTRQFLAAPPSGGKVRVLGLGSSLLWAATPPALVPIALPGIDWMRMTKPGPGIGYLEPSLDIIDRNPPDILVIDENILLPDQDNVIMDQLRQDFILESKGLAFRLAGDVRLAPPQAYAALVDQREAFACATVPADIRRRETLKNAANIQLVFNNPAVNPQLIRRLQRLAQRGVRIVLLELRRAEWVEQIIAPEKQRWLSRLRQALPPGPNIHYLTSPHYAQQDLHCDGSHMNAAGARLFAPWWATQLQQLRDGR
ncbi:hypothetical protein BZG29_06340 [Janthinobacterium sp. LM6]|uniref:hypothetical protein n=1 Tax=Janthinobacterium sp. LM6 TaxID=1938606 RepID=UPI000983C1EC|nr:hypothetical protein [Janthinobacterium sp. LM6]AQR68016.1 hypothetical protein BZG29_06340 [Janthinobacterium sp. LM6]